MLFSQLSKRSRSSSSAFSAVTMSVFMQRLGRVRCKQIKIFLFLLVLIFILYYYGIFTRLSEDSFENFHYPLDVDVKKIIYQLQSGETPDVKPVNPYNYPYLIENNEKCKASGGKIFLLFLVKSKVSHFESRAEIRRTWGNEHHRDYPELPVKVVFLLGAADEDLQYKVGAEQRLHQDLVQGDFKDAYYNNTLKTLMAFHWVVNHCSNVQYYMCIDDDYYVNLPALIQYLHRSRRSEEDPAFIGYVTHSRPQRHRPSKFYVSLDEYPYSRYPPYVAAGAYVLTYGSLLTLHHASSYTRLYRFDDVYLGILAHRAHIPLTHNEHFYFWKKYYTPHNYRHLLVSHGYGNVEELASVWGKQQAAAGTLGSHTHNTWTDTILELMDLALQHIATLFT